jgi:hypothetical protein
MLPTPTTTGMRPPSLRSSRRTNEEHAKLSQDGWGQATTGARETDSGGELLQDNRAAKKQHPPMVLHQQTDSGCKRGVHGNAGRQKEALQDVGVIRRRQPHPLGHHRLTVWAGTGAVAGAVHTYFQLRMPWNARHVAAAQERYTSPSMPPQASGVHGENMSVKHAKRQLRTCTFVMPKS